MVVEYPEYIYVLYIHAEQRKMHTYEYDCFPDVSPVSSRNIPRKPYPAPPTRLVGHVTALYGNFIYKRYSSLLPSAKSHSYHVLTFFFFFNPSCIHTLYYSNSQDSSNIIIIIIIITQDLVPSISNSSSSLSGRHVCNTGGPHYLHTQYLRYLTNILLLLPPLLLLLPFHLVSSLAI